MRKQQVRTRGSFSGVAGKKARVLSRFVFGEDQGGEQRREAESCHCSTKKSEDHVGWMLARRWASAPFRDWVVLLRQAMVKMECTPERLQ